ncbi:hypothetical protein SUNI508_05482 [Seiridium unicorne]|uniref:Uncharacterized protein n=1 Tax=Seiridium unicorne TaxID=138068 RepID=A0ABR2V3R5_9PEZI
MLSFKPIILIAAAASAMPLAERADETWQVTDFSAYVAAHSISQMYCVLLRCRARKRRTSTVQRCDECAVTNALLSSSPSLLYITDGKCVEESGLSFNFTQVADFAIKLDVQNAQGVRATHTSDTNSVSFISTGPTPLDTETAYTGPHDFDLVVVGESV